MRCAGLSVSRGQSDVNGIVELVYEAADAALFSKKLNLMFLIHVTAIRYDVLHLMDECHTFYFGR